MNNPYFRKAGQARLWLVALLLLLLGLPGLAQTISTVAGDGTNTGTGNSTGFTLGVAVDPAGNIYVAGGNAHVIRKVTPGGVYSTVAGTGTAGFSGDGGQATSAQVNAPADVFVINNNLYIADVVNRRIRKVDLSTGIITTVAGDGTTNITGNGVGFALGVAADAAGNIYVATGNGHVIRKITTGGTYSNFAGTGTASYSGDGGQANAATLNNPVDIFFSSNAVYIAELNSRYIRKVDLSTNVITSVAGDGTTNITGNGIGFPNGVSVDGAGNILVAAGNGNVIRKITPAGVHSTVAGTGTAGFSGDGGPATSAQVASPIDMSALGNDIYIADRDNYRIRKVTNVVVTAPTVTTAAATAITTTGATLGGNVTADGGATVTTRGVVYSSTNTTPTIGGSGVTQNDNGTGTGSFSEPITGLAPGTTYYVQAYATNSAGTNYGGVQTFTTATTTPTVTTTAAGSVTSSSAVLGGNITADGGAAVTGRGVVYSSTNTTPTIGGSGTTTAPNGSGTGTFSATITGLAPGTAYYVQAYAINSNGTVYGGVQTFTTAANLATVTTAAATSVTTTSAVLGGNVTATGGATVTGRGVVYSVTSTNGTPTIGGSGVTTTPNGSGTGSFSATISGLAPGTAYSVQAYATNSTGTSYGGVQTFTTTAVAVATSQSVTVNLDANGNGTLAASSVNNGSTGAGTLTYTIQKIVYGRVTENNTLNLSTPSGANFSAIRFASYGTPTNDPNGNYRLGSCNAANSLATAQNSFVGRNNGNMDAVNVSSANNNPTLGDPCGGTPKALAVQAAYSADAASLTYACVEAGKTQYVLLTVTDTNGSTSTSVASVTVNAPPTVTLTNATPSPATPGATVTVSGTNLSGLTSLTVNGATATISGLTSTGFTFVVPSGATLGAGTISVTAPCAQTVTRAFTVQAPTITLAPATLPNGTVATAYSQTITASGGTAPYTYAITAGALPAGLTLSSAGVLSGTPTAGGSFTFTVTATDASTGSGPFSGSRSYTLTIAAPTIAVAPATLPNGATNTAYSQIISASGGTAPYSYAITAGALPAGLTLASNGALSGTPTAAGSFTFTVTATDASTGSGPYSGSRSYTLTIVNSTTTVASVTRLTPSPTATASVSYRVVFAASVTGVTVSNFTTTNSGTTVTGSSVSSVSGSGTTYTVTVNTGTGDGTLRLDVANSTGISPTVSNVPYTTGETYTITKSFAAQPQLTIVGTGGTGSDVTAFVDVAQVLSGGSTFANGLQNGSFESHNALANGDYGYNPTGANWTFNAQSGIAESGSAFTPVTPIPNGIAVAFLQSNSGGNGQIQQNLAVPTGNSYQVRFQASQRNCCTTGDQGLNVFLNGVFLGTVQPANNNAYTTFTSATFAVTAPALTATVSTTSASPTSTSPIPFSVSFSQSVGTTFTASDVTVTGGTLNGGSFAGSGSGPYTFTVTPAGTGTVTVSLAANVANDANNTQNSASNSVSVQYNQPVTAAPVVALPANGSFVTTTTPAYSGTAPANSTVTVYVDGSSIGTTTATASGSFSLAQPTALSQGSHTVYATAQASGSAVSANSNTNTFTVDSVQPSVAISSSAGASGSTTATSPIPFTVTFSENVTGFVAGDVSVTNGTITGFTAVSGTVYTFNVTPTTAGTATTVNVPANVAQDAAANFNTAAPSVYSLTFTAPTIAVSPATLPNGTVAAAYSQVLTASGGTAPYTYAITAGALPAGLSLTAAGVLSGTPTAGGSYTFTVRATDASAAPGPYNGSRSYTLVITAPTIAVSPATLPNGTVAAAYSQAITASGGTAPYSFAITAGALPSGLTLTSAGVLSGTPTASGTFNFTVTATDASTGSGPYSGSRAYSLTVGSQPVTAAPVVTTPANGTFVNTATPAYTGTAVAGSTVTVYVDGTAIGTTTATGGNFSLTQPTVLSQGSHTVYATAQTSGQAVSGSSATNTFTVDTVQPTVAISSSTAANGGSTSTSPIAYTVTFSENVTGFVAGDVSVGNGTITGFTAVSGTTYTFNVTPTANGAVTVNVPAAVAQDGAGNFNTAAPSAYTITYAQPVTAAPVVALPANGSFVTTTTPAYSGTAPANSTVTVYVDGSSIGTTTATASGSFSLTQPTALSQGAHTVYATAQTSGSAVSANSNTNTFTVDSVQPSVAISSSAGASGGTTGTSPIPFTVTFSEAVTGFVTGDLTVTNGTITGFTAVSGTVYTFNVTPTTAGTATTVNVPANVAQDQAGNFNTAAASAYSLTFTAPTITVTPATLPNGTQGAAYSQVLTASGGTAPYTYAITAGALPTGLSLTGSTISGTPTANGSFTFTVTATDNSVAPGPYSGSRSYSLTIGTPASVTWNGSVSTDWFTAANWTPNVVPDATVNATIPTAPSGNRFPVIAAGTGTTNALTISVGATLTQTGGTLDVRADLTNNGAFAPTGGTVVLGTTFQSNGPNVLGSSNTRFWNLTVNSNGVNLGTSAGASVRRLLTLNGALVTKGNAFVLESDATNTALVVNNGSGGFVFGSATVQRYIAPDLNAGLGYRHYSAPVGTATVASLATGSFSPVVNPAYNTSATPTAVTPFPTVYGYDQARLATATNNLAAFDKGWFSPNSTGDALTVGQGYTVNLAANQTLSVNGPLNNNNVALNLSRNSGATAADAGWALVGNPYPSPLDYSLVAPADRANLDAAIYVFESTSQYAGTYRANVNGVGGNANSPNSILAQGQGFFVRVSNGQTSGTLTLRNSQRLTSYTNPVYHRTAETRPLVQLDLTSATGTDPVYVYFENGATTGVDREMDAVKLPNSNGLNVSAETSAQRLAINALPTLGTATVTVPLTVGVPAAGSFSFNASQLLNLSTTPVYLRDRLTGAVVDLARQPSYSFVVSNATALITGRFELVFAPQAPLATAPAALAAQVGVYPNPATTTAFVELPAALGRVAVSTELVDALGRTVRTQSLPAQGAAAHRLDLANLATGVYTLHLNTSAGVIVKKLVVQ